MMLNRQLYMPEHEAIKQKLIEPLLYFSPEQIGYKAGNYIAFKKYFRKAHQSGLFSEQELQSYHKCWDDWFEHIKTRDEKAEKWLALPWYKRIFS